MLGRNLRSNAKPWTLSIHAPRDDGANQLITKMATVFEDEGDFLLLRLA